jgi:hypothetical protein
MIKLMDMENIFMLMVLAIKDNGKMIYNMVMGYNQVILKISLTFYFIY